VNPQDAGSVDDDRKRPICKYGLIPRYILDVLQPGYDVSMIPYDEDICYLCREILNGPRAAKRCMNGYQPIKDTEKICFDLREHDNCTDLAVYSFARQSGRPSSYRDI
jgi:hypothetical protein